jgi:molybdopterin biosynthesis enzyme
MDIQLTSMVNLQVYRRPSVAVLSTGDELVEPDTNILKWGQVGSLLWLSVRDILIRNGFM